MRSPWRHRFDSAAMRLDRVLNRSNNRSPVPRWTNPIESHPWIVGDGLDCHWTTSFGTLDEASSSPRPHCHHVTFLPHYDRVCRCFVASFFVAFRRTDAGKFPALRRPTGAASCRNAVCIACRVGQDRARSTWRSRCGWTVAAETGRGGAYACDVMSLYWSPRRCVTWL